MEFFKKTKHIKNASFTPFLPAWEDFFREARKIWPPCACASGLLRPLHDPLHCSLGEGNFSFYCCPRALTEGLPGGSLDAVQTMWGSKPTWGVGGVRRPYPSPAVGYLAGEPASHGPSLITLHPSPSRSQSWARARGVEGAPTALGEPPSNPSQLPGCPIPPPASLCSLLRTWS